jgi:cytochrome c biogenesis protein CcmG/thiol:disulfide interchange protein DsbE
MKNNLGFALLIMMGGIAVAAAQPGVSAALQPARERKPAPGFALKDVSQKTVKLTDYRGKVVLLDFWATWCTGCKKEIPWFSEFQAQYGDKGFAVVGMSLDEGGWAVLKPFLTEHKIPYQMVLGDHSTADRFGIKSMPDTLLIDRNAKVAASYIAGLVDRANIETNIKALLEEH